MAQQFSFNSVPVPVHDEWNITPQEVERNIGYRFFPHLLEGEGFFCAVMQKPVTEHDKTHSIKSRTARSEPVFQVSSLPKELTAWIDPVASAGTATIFTSADGRRYLHQSEFDTTWLRALRRMSPGTAIADQQSMIFTPAHALALSQCLHPDIPSLELDKDQAIVFLRKESVKANAADLGWYVARYDGHALGWLKQTHSGLKNYLPIKYRILKQ
jgi:NOL1/NOP2/fmu family ribosome biogenesis protein